MFGVPAAKRIRRADLYSPPSSLDPSEPDNELIALLHSSLEHVYGPVVIDGQLSPKKPNAESCERGELDRAPKDPEQGFEFRLFASPRNRQPTSSHDPDGAAHAPRVILEDEHDAGDLGGQGGFVVPRRGEEYYFTDAVTPAQREERRKEFDMAAMSGEDVRRWLGVRYSGWEVRWRVRVLRDGKLVGVKGDTKEAVASPLAAGLAPDGQDEVGVAKVGKKCKPGKKRRIILRVKKRKGEEEDKRRREEAERKKREEREWEEADREKRTRKNREKKVKKKMKEREKKRMGEGNNLGDAEGGNLDLSESKRTLPTSIHNLSSTSPVQALSK